MKTRLEEQVQIDTMESMAKEIEVTKEEVKTHTHKLMKSKINTSKEN